MGRLVGGQGGMQAGEWFGGQADRKEVRQKEFYMARFEPAKGGLQKLVLLKSHKNTVILRI